MWEYSNGGFKYIIDSFFFLKEIYNRIFRVCSNKYYCLLKKKKKGMFIPHWLYVSSVRLCNVL